MINPYEINSHSRMMVEQRRQEAELYRLAQIAIGRAERPQGYAQSRDWIRQLLSGLITRLWVVRLGHTQRMWARRAAQHLTVA